MTKYLLRRFLISSQVLFWSQHFKVPLLCNAFPPAQQCVHYSRKINEQIDYSKVPVLDENDIEENYVKGGGPGGSKVNKSTNCVVVRHKPTGIVHKCHLSRSLRENRTLARAHLVEKLDDYFNGEMSVKAQRERLEKKRSQENEKKSKNVAEMKRKYLEHVTAINVPSRSDESLS